MKKVARHYFIFLAALVMVFSAGCSSKEATKKDAGELNLFIWTEYMPESVIKAFEKETGVKVNMITYSSNENMLAKVKGGAKGIYDIVVPTDYMVEKMIKENLLAKINKDALKNINNIDPVYANPSYDPKSQYSVPFMVGLAALIIDKTKVTDDITSFSQIFDPKYKSSIVILDDYRAIIGAVSRSMGFDMEPPEKEFAKVDAKLQTLKPNIKLRDSDSPKTAMLNGETAIGYMWNAEIAICLQERPDDFKVVFPKEGCYLFIDSMVILEGAKNMDNALKFIDFILRPEISAMISEEFPYTNPNKAAVENLPASYKDNPASNLDPKIIKKGQFTKNVGAAILNKYDAMWTKFIK